MISAPKANLYQNENLTHYHLDPLHILTQGLQIG